MVEAAGWSGVINGRSYRISYRKRGGQGFLIINGVARSMRRGFLSVLIGFDEAIDLDGVEVRLVIQENRLEAAVNGVYVRSGEPYKPRPSWLLAFVFLCLAVPVASLGGILPLFLGIGGALLCGVFARLDQPVSVRVILCAGVTVVAWAIWIALMVGLTRLLS